MATSKKALNTRSVQLSVEGLFKLLGGSSSDRLRFWEIIKGITTPAEFRLINQQLKTMDVLARQFEQNAKTLQQTAASIAKQQG